MFCLIPAMARLTARRQDLKNQLPDIITLSEEPPLQESPGESPPLYSPPPPPPPRHLASTAVIPTYHSQTHNTSCSFSQASLSSIFVAVSSGGFFSLRKELNKTNGETSAAPRTYFLHLVSLQLLAPAAAVDYAPLGWLREGGSVLLRLPPGG